jgi:hypothetical protein
MNFDNNIRQKQVFFDMDIGKILFCFRMQSKSCPKGAAHLLRECGFFARQERFGKKCEAVFGQETRQTKESRAPFRLGRNGICSRSSKVLESIETSYGLLFGSKQSPRLFFLLRRPPLNLLLAQTNSHHTMEISEFMT